MECTTCYCPHPPWTHDGKRGFGAHLVRRGADHGRPRLLCPRCASTFAARRGTAYCGVRAEEPHDTIALRAVAEGHALRSTGRLSEVDTETVCDWLARAGRHCRAVTTSVFDSLPITACHVDAFWSVVRKNEAHLTVAERVLALAGEAWVWMACVPAWRLGAACVVGNRDQESANVLLERRHAGRCGSMPCFPSEQ